MLNGIHNTSYGNMIGLSEACTGNLDLEPKRVCLRESLGHPLDGLECPDLLQNLTVDRSWVWQSKFKTVLKFFSSCSRTSIRKSGSSWCPKVCIWTQFGSQTSMISLKFCLRGTLSPCAVGVLPPYGPRI